MSDSSKIYNSQKLIETEKLRCWIEINLSNLKKNIEMIKSIIPENYNIICVLKANSYGLGSIMISKYLSSIGINYFAVATLEEALELRNLGKVNGEIIILNWVPLSEIETIIKNNLTLTLIDYEYAKHLNSLSKVIKCYIKIDLGTNRFGFKKNDIKKIVNCFTFKNLKIEGFYSHICRNEELSKEDDNHNKIQIENYNYIIKKLEEDGVKTGLNHLINSFQILNYNENKSYFLQKGLLMYRIYPYQNNMKLKLLNKYKFKPISSLKCKIVQVKNIKKGDKVGYNSKYIANDKTKIAIISIGYADGLSFSSSKNELNVIVNGVLCPIIGNICMDCSIIKIPLESDIKEGDIVTIFGYNNDGEEYINMKEFILKSGSPIREVFSRLGSRIIRIYHL